MLCAVPVVIEIVTTLPTKRTTAPVAGIGQDAQLELDAAKLPAADFSIYSAAQLPPLTRETL